MIVNILIEQTNVSFFNLLQSLNLSNTIFAFLNLFNFVNLIFLLQLPLLICQSC